MDCDDTVVGASMMQTLGTIQNEPPSYLTCWALGLRLQNKSAREPKRSTAFWLTSQPEAALLTCRKAAIKNWLLLDCT